MAWRSPFKAFHDGGVLGINRRNAEYIFGYNPRRLYPLVDDKLQTKALCASWGLTTPETFGVISAHGELKRDLGKVLAPLEEFVVKPAHGAMGNGVLVITGREGEGFVRSSGAVVDLKFLRYHVSGVLSGLYSLGGRADQAIIEYRVRIHPVFERISYGGVPDCRVIVFRGVPVMSMLRLPTQMSDGRANLHQGAIAAGVDIAHGETHNAVHLNRVVYSHPDTLQPVQGIPVPEWDEILYMSAVSAEMTGLGYIGVDVVLDRDRGPMLLELNARPGLSIQIANGAGLIPLLDRIRRLDLTGLDAWKRVALAKELFADHVDTGLTPPHPTPVAPPEGVPPPPSAAPSAPEETDAPAPAKEMAGG